MKQETLFKAISISKAFNKKSQISVLENLDLDIIKGEMISITGVSGTGKTTLLNILGTLERPTSGSLLYKEKDIFAKSSQSLAVFRNKTVGFVFQFHHLLPEFTALENIMLPGMIAGLNRDELDHDAHELLAKIGLENRASHKIGELSGGEQQRTALARALIMKPAILLADEPTGNLDPKTGYRVFDLIAELTEFLSMSSVMVTHNYELAKQMDRCLTLEKGQLHDMNLQ